MLFGFGKFNIQDGDTISFLFLFPFLFFFFLFLYIYFCFLKWALLLHFACFLTVLLSFIICSPSQLHSHSHSHSHLHLHLQLKQLRWFLLRTTICLCFVSGSACVRIRVPRRRIWDAWPPWHRQWHTPPRPPQCDRYNRLVALRK